MKKIIKAFMLLAVALFSITLLSCGGDDDNSINVTSSKDVSLGADETSQITCDQTGVNYESEDQFVAKVSTSGLITANHVGSTYITINGSRAVKVTVSPKYTQFVEPITDFGISTSTLITKEGAQPASSTSTTMIFDGTGKEFARIYLLENGKTKAAGLIVSSGYSSSLSNFLLERYQVVDVGTYSSSTSSSYKYTAMFVNGLSSSTITMAVGLGLYSTKYWIALYYPVDLSSSSSNIVESGKYIEKMKSALAVEIQ